MKAKVTKVIGVWVGDSGDTTISLKPRYVLEDVQLTRGRPIGERATWYGPKSLTFDEVRAVGSRSGSNASNGVTKRFALLFVFQ